MIYKNTLFPLKQEQTKLKFYYVSEKKESPVFNQQGDSIITENILIKIFQVFYLF